MSEKSSSVEPPTEAASSFLSGFLFHDRKISVGLVSYHLPASSKARQNRSFGSALCQQHAAMAFLSLGPATTCFLHFPPGINIGQRRPPRHTRPKTTRAGYRWQLRQSKSQVPSIGLMRLADLIGAWCTPPIKGEEHNALCHRISALWLGGDGGDQIT
jgi:hypothetical protein